MKLKSYVKGATCKYCIENKTVEKIQASVIRQKQIDSAEEKNINHPFKSIFTNK